MPRVLHQEIFLSPVKPKNSRGLVGDQFEVATPTQTCVVVRTFKLVLEVTNWIVCAKSSKVKELNMVEISRDHNCKFY